MSRKNSSSYSKHQSLLSRFKKELKIKKTESEKRIEVLLRESGIAFIDQKGFHTDASFIIADFYIPKPYKVIVEVDGNSHDNKRVQDAARDDFMWSSRRINTLRIRNEQAFLISKNQLKRMIYVASKPAHYCFDSPYGICDYILSGKVVHE